MILEFRLSKVGFPIRKSMDQSLFAAPHSLSQRSTSFIASHCQGIHRIPLRHLIALIINIHTLGRVCCKLSVPKHKSARDAVKHHELQAAGYDLERPVICFSKSNRCRGGQASAERTRQRKLASKRSFLIREITQQSSDLRPRILFGSISSIRCHKSRERHH